MKDKVKIAFSNSFTRKKKNLCFLASVPSPRELSERNINRVNQVRTTSWVKLNKWSLLKNDEIDFFQLEI